MTEQQIPFRVGDQVIHWSHGPGVIIQVDEKSVSGRKQQYYVVEMNNLTLWVPVEQNDDCSLRLPTPKRDFEALFQILTSPGKPLSTDRNERRLELIERLKNHNLVSIFEIIRDLNLHQRQQKMNDNDKITLERSQNFLIYEWSVVSAIPLRQAEQEVRKLLKGDEHIS